MEKFSISVFIFHVFTQPRPKPAGLGNYPISIVKASWGPVGCPVFGEQNDIITTSTRPLCDIQRFKCMASAKPKPVVLRHASGAAGSGNDGGAYAEADACKRLLGRENRPSLFPHKISVTARSATFVTSVLFGIMFLNVLAQQVGQQFRLPSTSIATRRGAVLLEVFGVALHGLHYLIHCIFKTMVWTENPVSSKAKPRRVLAVVEHDELAGFGLTQLIFLPARNADRWTTDLGCHCG